MARDDVSFVLTFAFCLFTFAFLFSGRLESSDEGARSIPSALLHLGFDVAVHQARLERPPARELRRRALPARLLRPLRNRRRATRAPAAHASGMGAHRGD